MDAFRISVGDLNGDGYPDIFMHLPGSEVGDEDIKRQCLSELAGLDLVPVMQAGGADAVRTEIDKCISRYLA